MFEKIKKKYALNNSYFKNITPYNPRTTEECFEYLKEYKELPFRYEAIGAVEYEHIFEWWLYDCYVEYQKRFGVYNSQFFTPRKTAERMAQLAELFFEGTRILDACCGFGSLTKVFHPNFEVRGLEIDHGLANLYKEWTMSEVEEKAFQNFKGKETNIISNPPYEIPVLTEFLEWLYETLTDDGTAILLIPKGFIDKERPKKLVQVLEKFQIIYREDMQEEFARTKTRAEIVVLRK